MEEKKSMELQKLQNTIQIVSNLQLYCESSQQTQKVIH